MEKLRMDKIRYYKFPNTDSFAGIFRRIMSDDRIVVVFPTRTIGKRIVPRTLHDSILSYDEAISTCRLVDVSDVIFIIPFMGYKDKEYTKMLYAFGEAQANVDIYE